MDERYQLTTPENVPISYELAGIGSRFVAALLDGLIISAAEIGLFVLASLVSANLGQQQAALAAVVVAIAILLGFLLAFGYTLVFEIVWSGQTPGKRKVGLRVVKDDGSPLTATAAAIRNVVRLVDFLPAYYTIGVITMLIDRQGRRLGDLAAGTIVVKEKADLAPNRLTLSSAGMQQPEGLVDGTVLLNLRRLSYDDYHLIQEYLLRREGLAPGPAHELAVRIAGIIAAKLDLDLAGDSPESFLARVGRAVEGESRRLG